MLRNNLQNSTIKKRIIPYILLPVFFLGLSTPQVYAEGISLRVNPSVLQIRTQAPSDIHAPFIIQNQSDQSIKLKIGYKLFNPTKSQQGKVVFLDDPNATSPIFEHIEVTDTDNTPLNTLDLGPKQQKQLQLRVTLPENQPSADHYFSLIFLSDLPTQTDQNSTIKDKKDQHSITTIQGGIGANVLLAVGAPETAQGYIEEFATPWYLQSGPVPFSVKVKNTGLHYINPVGVIRIKNVFGQTVGKIQLPATAVLSGTTRSMLDDKQITKAIQSEDPKAFWPERFLMGIYSATLEISMASEGPIYTQTIRFIAFPLNLLLGLILVITLGTIIFVKVKKKVS